MIFLCIFLSHTLHKFVFLTRKRNKVTFIDMMKDIQDTISN